MKRRAESATPTRIGSDIQAAFAKRGKNLTDDEAEQLTRALLDLVRHGLLEPVKES